jgi:spore germination protein GerM
MRTNVLLAAGVAAVLGIGGGVLLQSDQLSILPTPSRVTGHPSDTMRPATEPVTHPAEVRNEETNVVRSKAPVRTVDLPYFVIHDTGDDLLLSERHAGIRVAGATSNWRMARTALSAMERAPREEGRYQNPLPEGTRILGVHIDLTSGIASVNLSREFMANFNGGARAEQMTVYAIVNTVGKVKGVRGVTFQIDGKPIDEFAGHLDLSEPLVPDDSIVEKAS